MTPAPRLCVVGDYAWDITVHTETELQRGGDTFGQIQLHPGGSAANVAVWARRCGIDVSFIGKVGDDRLGVLAREELTRERIDHHLSVSPDRPTGSVAVLVDPSGERSMVSGHGADFTLVADEVPREVIERCGHVHVVGWSLFTDPPRPAINAATVIARRAGATVSLDPSSYQVIDEVGVDTFIDWVRAHNPNVVFPNFDEGRMLTGAQTPELIARRLVEMFPEALIVLKLDARGALLARGEQLTEVAAHRVELVDATGAGDSFAGAFLASWLLHRDPARAAEFAGTIAAGVIAQPGARPPMTEAQRQALR